MPRARPHTTHRAARCSSQEAREEREEAEAAGGPAAAAGERSAVELMLDLIFEIYPTQPDASWFEHAPKLNGLKQELLRCAHALLACGGLVRLCAASRCGFALWFLQRASAGRATC